MSTINGENQLFIRQNTQTPVLILFKNLNVNFGKMCVKNSFSYAQKAIDVL